MNNEFPKHSRLDCLFLLAILLPFFTICIIVFGFNADSYYSNCAYVWYSIYLIALAILIWHVKSNQLQHKRQNNIEKTFEWRWKLDRWFIFAIVLPFVAIYKLMHENLPPVVESHYVAVMFIIYLLSLTLFFIQIKKEASIWQMQEMIETHQTMSVNTMNRNTSKKTLRHVRSIQV